MQVVRDSGKESCAMQRAAKVKDGKSIGKNEKKYKNTTQDHGRTNSSDGHAKISGQSQGKILFEEEVIKLPKVELTPSIQGLCWTSVTRHVNSLWSFLHVVVVIGKW